MSRRGLLVRIAVALISFGAAAIVLHDTGLPESDVIIGGLDDRGNYLPPGTSWTAFPFTLTSVADQRVVINPVPGKVTLLSFWATWCPPCRHEMLQLQSIHELESRSIRIVAVNLGEDSASVAKWVQDLHLTYHVLRDPDLAVAQRFGIRGLPTAVLLDEQLGILKFYYGPVDRVQLLQDIQQSS